MCDIYATPSTHTLKLRVDEDTTITVTYHNTCLSWVDFADDAAELLTRYAVKPEDIVSTTTEYRRS